VLRTIRRLRNYGKVSVNFGTPIDLGQHLDQHQPNWREHLQADGLDRPGWATSAIQQLGQEVVQRINLCAAVNPVNLLALALLAHPRQALDGETLCQQLALFQRIQQQVPASAELTLPAESPQQWIEHAVHLKILQPEQQPLGVIYRLNEAQAVLMTYYRNNILHLWVLPSLICNVISVAQWPKTRAAIVDLTARIDAYVQPELFIAGTPTDRRQLIEQYFDCLLELGLIGTENDHFVATTDRYQRMHVHTLRRMMQPTLERYYLTLATLVGHGTHTLSPQALETQAKAMAQRMAALHGLNAPEFFDSSLFRQFIQSLREHDLIQLDAANQLTFTQPIVDILNQTESIMDEALVRQVHLMTQRWSAESPAHPPAKTDTPMLK
jgi:glycerol-3-phosphate O-acyltransferase